ncbi:MAG: rhomboid family intramembrane serine protease, partial [Candidatus Hydrogenedentota bacterium]
MIPLHDDNPTETTPFFTIALIAGNILVFVYELTLPTLASAQQFVMSFAMIPGEIVSADIRREAVTLFTSMFLHAGIMHLAGNMIYLWIFGNNIEDAVGHIKFLIFYLLCGLAATFAESISMAAVAYT